MDLRDTSDQKTISAEAFAMEFGDQPQTWTIERFWKYKPPNDEKQKTCVKFVEHPLSVVLNKKRRDVIGYTWGFKDRDSIGYQLVLTHHMDSIPSMQREFRTIKFVPVKGERKFDKVAPERTSGPEPQRWED